MQIKWNEREIRIQNLIILAILANVEELTQDQKCTFNHHSWTSNITWQMNTKPSSILAFLSVSESFKNVKSHYMTLRSSNVVERYDEETSSGRDKRYVPLFFAPRWLKVSTKSGLNILSSWSKSMSQTQYTDKMDGLIIKIWNQPRNGCQQKDT